jgi:hypothetical protein
MLFKEIVAVFSESHTKPINTLCVKKCVVILSIVLETVAHIITSGL